jgi:hypothetical protein
VCFLELEATPDSVVEVARCERRCAMGGLIATVISQSHAKPD